MNTDIGIKNQSTLTSLVAFWYNLTPC